jgi:hypothetical protein
LDAHRAGEMKAVQKVTAIKKQMADCINDRDEKIRDYDARYQQLDQERQLLHTKYINYKRGCEQLNER